MNNAIAILDILSWPLVTLAIAFIFRKPLTSLLSAVQKIKYRNLEFKFQFKRTLRQTSEELSETADVRINGDPSDERLSGALKLPPGQAVPAAWNALENFAGEKVSDLLPAYESFKNPLGRPLDYLDFKGALTPATARAIRDLRSLRNQVVQFGEDLVGREDANRYVSIAEGLMKAIDAVTELPKVKLTAITLLVLEINSLIDSKKFDDVTIREVYKWIKNENVIGSLAERAKGHVHLGDYGVDGPYRNFAGFYHEQMKRLYDGYGGSHEKKWRVENRGLCLLLAWTNELIQQGSGWHPDEL